MPSSGQLPPFEEWPRVRWWSRGPVQWWWSVPLGILIVWLALALVWGSAQAALVALLAFPFLLAFGFWQYRTWRRNAAPSLPR